MDLLKQDEKLGRFTSSLYICHTKAMTALVQYGIRWLFIFHLGFATILKPRMIGSQGLSPYFLLCAERQAVRPSVSDLSWHAHESMCWVCSRKGTFFVLSMRLLCHISEIKKLAKCLPRKQFLLQKCFWYTPHPLQRRIEEICECVRPFVLLQPALVIAGRCRWKIKKCC